MSIISKLFNIKKKDKQYSLGNYEIRKFKDGSYAVYNTKKNTFVSRCLESEIWTLPSNINNYCKVDSLSKAERILYGIADKGEPLK